MQEAIAKSLRNKIEREMIRAPSLRNYGGSPKICVINNYVYSYNTCVGVMDWATDNLYVPVYHSTTTTRHINKMAQEYNLEVVKLY